MPGSRALLIGGFGALLFAAAAWLAAVPGGRPHLAESDCTTCHLAGKPVDPAQASRLVATQEKLCGACHEAATKISHPSGFAPKIGLPAEFPLDWKGDLTCSTCHLPHGDAPGLLRGAKRGKELCTSCHDAGFFRAMKDQGSSIVLSGHLIDRAAMASIESDSYSLHCMGCHSSLGGALGVSINRNGVMRHASGDANHPIGRRYRDAARSGGFRPENSLSRAVMLPGGKISCVSCHRGYNRDHGKLVMSNDRSKLCFHCHDI